MANKIKPNTTCNDPILSTDFYPSFIELAGADRPANYTLDGQNILPLFNGAESIERPPLFWHFPAYLQSYKGLKDHSRDTTFRTRPVSVIRNGDWKLLMYHEEWVLDGGREKMATNNAVELYNLKTDLAEKHNVANAEKAKTDELLDQLLAWMKEMNAPMPSEANPYYEAP